MKSKPRKARPVYEMVHPALPLFLKLLRLLRGTTALSRLMLVGYSGPIATA